MFYCIAPQAIFHAAAAGRYLEYPALKPAQLRRFNLAFKNPGELGAYGDPAAIPERMAANHDQDQTTYGIHSPMGERRCAQPLVWRPLKPSKRRSLPPPWAGRPAEPEQLRNQVAMKCVPEPAGRHDSVR